MYLYEAMLRGAKLRGQCTVDWFKDDKSCALGSIWEGLDRSRDTCFSTNLQDEFPILDEIVSHPMSNIFPRDVYTIIWQLNDKCGWTREAIAEWLKPIELEFEQRQIMKSKDSVQPLEQLVEVSK